MKKLVPVALIALIIVLCGWGNPIYLASRLPGLRQVSDSMNRHAFREWMESDPEPEVRSRIARGEYSLLGLSLDEKDQRWIPGVPDAQADLELSRTTWQGVSGDYSQYIPIAERYMTKFNRLMLDARTGVHLDDYGHSAASSDYIKPKE